MRKQQIQQELSSILYRLNGYIAHKQQKSLSVLSRLNKDIFKSVSKEQIIFTLLRESVLENKDITQCFREHKEYGKSIKISDYVDRQTAGIEVGNADSLVDKAEDYYTALRLHELFSSSSQEIDPNVIDKFIPDFQSKYLEITGVKERESTEITDIMQEYEATQLEYAEKTENGKKLLGHSSGFAKIDTIIDGLRSQHIWVIGGYTSSGKTFFSLNLLNSLIEQKVPTAFFSLEMSKIDVISRLLGLNARVNGIKILKGSLPEEEYKLATQAKNKLLNAPITIHTTTRTLSELKMSIIEQKLRNKVEVVFIDYVQLVNVEGASGDYEAMKRTALDLQNLAKEQNITIVLLSQLSNESVRNKKSNIMGFKGAQDIAASADFAVELWVEDEKKKDELIKLGEPLPIKCHVKKNRHGGTGVIYFKFEGFCGRFTQDYERTAKEK